MLTIVLQLPTIFSTVQFSNRGPHQHHRVHVARRQGLPRAVQQGGRLREPPDTVHVRGEVQGATRFTVPAIPSYIHAFIHSIDPQDCHKTLGCGTCHNHKKHIKFTV